STSTRCSSPPSSSWRRWRPRRAADLAKAFAPFAEALAADEQKIVEELLAVQGSPADIGGYYQPEKAKADAVMRPSATWNAALGSLS
ncbi:NADP-dependent isocitrate dehydrogenase, partial [Streptomyces seoulensis]|uniref:NADP-dependent isocitrate dehydrogenase n=1 Tax=Streptomyces seoulensis TaxID=73044 RepID=UPI0033A00B28